MSAGVIEKTDPAINRQEIRHLLLLAVASVAVLFADAAGKELHGTAVFYASLVREIVDSGDWMGIYTDARAYLLKPPLVVWLSAASCEVFGLTNFGVTFVSRLAGVGCVVLTYLVMRRWWSHGVAWLAGFVLLTNSTFVQFTATLRMDSLLMLGFLVSIAGWAYRDNRWGAPALFGGVTIAVLSKGPLGFAAIPLILLHAVLLKRSPVAAARWRWAALLLPIVIWYGALASLHGAEPFNQLGADTLRATATPDLHRWESATMEYVVKPLRRYWPWLPFIVFGFVISVWRIVDSGRPVPERLTALWTVTWAVAVIAGAVAKPDHDIRYFYPALPVFGLFAGLAMMSLCRERFAGWVPPGLLGILIVAIIGRALTGSGTHDTRAQIAAIGVAIEGRPATLAIGGFPVPPEQPRRQNTHRDWVHFYTGTVPTVLGWRQVRELSPEFADGVFLTRSRGHEARLEEFALESKFTTREMIYAVPR